MILKILKIFTHGSNTGLIDAILTANKFKELDLSSMKLMADI